MSSAHNGRRKVRHFTTHNVRRSRWQKERRKKKQFIAEQLKRMVGMQLKKTVKINCLKNYNIYDDCKPPQRRWYLKKKIHILAIKTGKKIMSVSAIIKYRTILR